MARPDERRGRMWRFRLNDASTLEVSTPPPATEKQVRRRGRVSLVLGTLIAALMVSAVAGAAVWTDQDDYAPGSVVTISGDNSDGAGYLAGETVVVDVSGPNGYEASCEAVADDTGAWSCQVTLWDSDLAVGEYQYTATGQHSGVSESGTFTDAIQTQTTVTSNNNPSTFGDSVTFTATVKSHTTGTAPPEFTTTVTQGQVGFGTGDNCEGDFTQLQAAQTVDSNGQVTFTTSLLPVGTTTIRACYLGSGSGASALQKSDGTVTQTVNAASDANTAPVVTAATFASALINCNTGVALSVTFTDDASSTSWTYSVDWENDGTFDDVDLDTGLSAPGTFTTISHTYPLPGTYTAAVKVKDNQGLESTSFQTTNQLTVLQTYEVMFHKPIDGMVYGQTPEIVNTGRLGRVWPTKVTIFDNCGDTGWVNDPASPPTIYMKKVGTSGNVLTDPMEQYSAGSSNDGLYFRWSSDATLAGGGLWIFNLDSANPPGGWSLEKNSVYRIDVYVGATKATGSTATSQFAKVKPV